MKTFPDITDFLLPPQHRPIVEKEFNRGTFPHRQTVKVGIYSDFLNLYLGVVPIITYPVKDKIEAEILAKTLRLNNGWTKRDLPYIKANYVPTAREGDYQRDLLYKWEEDNLAAKSLRVNKDDLEIIKSSVDFPLDIQLTTPEYYEYSGKAASCTINRKYPLSSDIRALIKIDHIKGKCDEAALDILLHELAHAFDARYFRAYGHGPSFCLIYATLLKKYEVCKNPLASMISKGLSLPYNTGELDLSFC